jgi:hypothetical protein
MAAMAFDRAAEPRRPLRVARGAVVGAVAGGLALAGHAAGGAPLGPEPVVAALVVVGAAVVASQAAWSPARLLVVLLAAQAAVHGAAWIVSPSAPLEAVSAVSGAHHVHGAPAPQMLLAHVGAAAAAALLLAALEATVLGLWAAVHSRRVAASFRLPAARRPLCPLLAAPATSSAAVRARPRRGPPAMTALA